MHDLHSHIQFTYKFSNWNANDRREFFACVRLRLIKIKIEIEEKKSINSILFLKALE